MGRISKMSWLIVGLSAFVGSSGVLAWWEVNGAPVCTAVGSQEVPVVASDGAGGAIIAWIDDRVGGSDVYVQRVDATGTDLWAADGMAVCQATGSQFEPQLLSRGVGEAIVVTDAQGKLGQFNEAFLRMTGYSDVELQSTNFLQFIPEK